MLPPQLKTSPVFNTYWRFAALRQEIFFRRMSGPPPWTNDPILQKHKFTNAYRASDRVSQYLIRNVIYEGANTNYDDYDIIFRILLFKIFNKIETWEALLKEVDPCLRTFSMARYGKIFDNLRQDGQAIYSQAYMMSQPPLGFTGKHYNHLALLIDIMKDYEKITKAKSMSDIFNFLRSKAGLGDFLAYQYTVDINYSSVVNFDESSFVVPGPGARDGIRKCFTDIGNLTEVDVIKYVAEYQDEAFRQLKEQGITFYSLWGRPLQWIDCQNLFCETDKYAREAHPEILGISGRSRIKQKYDASAGVIKSKIDYFYPPKWNLQTSELAA